MRLPRYKDEWLELVHAAATAAVFIGCPVLPLKLITPAVVAVALPMAIPRPRKATWREAISGTVSDIRRGEKPGIWLRRWRLWVCWATDKEREWRRARGEGTDLPSMTIRLAGVLGIRLTQTTQWFLLIGALTMWLGRVIQAEGWYLGSWAG